MTAPPPERDPLTLILAAWGAALGTFTAAWNIHRDYTNKGRLRVHCFIGWIAGGGGVDQTDRLIYTVTNIGRQPVRPGITALVGVNALPQMFDPATQWRCVR